MSVSVVAYLSLIGGPLRLDESEDEPPLRRGEIDEPRDARSGHRHSSEVGTGPERVAGMPETR